MEEKKVSLTKKQWIICTAAVLVVICLVAGLVWILTRQRPSEDLSAADGAEVSIMDIMCEPAGIAAMGDGSFLITDTYEKVIWRLKDGESSRYAGGETVEDPYGEPLGGYNDAALEESYFKSPWAIVPFLEGYAVSDPDNDVVRYVDSGRVQTLNGSTNEDLELTELGWVAFHHPTGLASDEQGNLYIADTLENAIRRVTPEGDVTTFASNLEEPTGLCWQDGVLYVAETGANRIVKVEKGQVSVVAGSGKAGMEDGRAEQASFSVPKGVAADRDGTVYISDTGNSAIRKVQNGKVTTLLARDIDDLTAFSPVAPVGILLDGGRLYVCDTFSQKVYVIRIGGLG